mgnify:CR=1 FL=1
MARRVGAVGAGEDDRLAVIGIFHQREDFARVDFDHSGGGVERRGDILLAARAAGPKDSSMSKKLKGVCIGAGYFSHFQYEAWQRIPEVEIVAFSNRDPVKAAEITRKFGLTKCYPDYRAMFDQHVRREDMRAVFQEYAWDMSWCDPCAADPLSPDELRQAGVFWVNPPPAPAAAPASAPPRASPSSLVIMKPVRSRRRLNSLAVRTVSWPAMASHTKKMLSGLVRCLISSLEPHQIGARPSMDTCQVYQ